MPEKSFTAKSIIVTSAFIGAIVGLLELSDRFDFFGAGGSGDLNGAGLAGAPDVQKAPREAPAAEPEAVTSALQRDVRDRVGETLERLACSGVSVDVVRATARVVPEEETSHGFEGHVLDATVVLRGAGRPERIRLAGSGKGPTGAVSAVDMALRSFDDQIRQTDIFNGNCKGD